MSSEPAKKQQQQVVSTEEPKPENEPQAEAEEVTDEEVEEEEVPGVEFKQTSDDEGEPDAQGGDDDEGEPIQDLLNSFYKDKLMNLLKEAAESHRYVSDPKSSSEDTECGLKFGRLLQLSAVEVQCSIHQEMLQR